MVWRFTMGASTGEKSDERAKKKKETKEEREERRRPSAYTRYGNNLMNLGAIQEWSLSIELFRDKD